MITKNTVVLRGLGVFDEPGWSRLDWQVSGLAAGPIVLNHALPEAEQHLLPEPGRADHVLVAVLLRAMQERLNITIEGEVSPRLLDGLETLQEIWHRWRPSIYRVIEIRAESETEVTLSGDLRPAAFAFSGGVDGSFSLFRHLTGQAGRNTRRPGAALLVHGMDIPLDQPDFFANSADRAATMLEGTGVPVIRMRTNSRALKQNWEDSFGLQLAASFLILQGQFAASLRGSGEPYETLEFPWGSTPMTDHLTSTAAMTMFHDGCAFDRTEKVAWLAENTSVTDKLRVCWAGKELDRNCGRCEKCVRTMLNFWAVGLEPPAAAFPTKLTPQLVLTVRLRKAVQVLELESIARHAFSHGLERDPILKALRRVLRRKALAQAAAHMAHLGRRGLGLQ